MTTNNHPITPPPDLTDKWNNLPLSTEEIFVIAARWGADTELEACCSEVSWNGNKALAAELRRRRRPKPPSLKEQALALLDKNKTRFAVAEEDVIRRALEALPE